MINYRVKGICALCFLTEVISVSLIFWCWLPFSQTSWDVSRLPLDLYATYNLILVLGLQISHVSNKGRNCLNLSFLEANRETMRSITFALGFLFVFLVASRDKVISRIFLFGFIPLLYFILFFCKRKLPGWWMKVNFRGVRTERVLLIGTSTHQQTLSDWIRGKAQLGYKVMGCLSMEDEPGQSHASEFPYLGSSGQLEDCIQREQISLVVLLSLPDQRSKLQDWIRICEGAGIRLLAICDFEKDFAHPVMIFEDEGIHFLGLRPEPLEDPMVRAGKKLMDWMISIPVVLLVLPWFIALVWIIQRLYSPGPLFYRQKRAGLQNKTFEILKFRTMHTDHGQEARQASKGDSRIYPLGNLIRKFSIDELPQFLNVLKGDMSVIGPRPHLTQHNESFAKALHNYHVRAAVKPGITGLAQVMGYRGETKTDEDVIKRVKADIYYLENWSFSMDIWILFKTFWQILFPPDSAR